MRIVVALVMGALVGFAPAAAAEPPAPPAPIIPPPVQPANIGELKFTALDYYNSGAYLTDLQIATAPAIAAAGVDLISIGWLTHSAAVLDIGLDLQPLRA